jgi:hypothetical protein
VNAASLLSRIETAAPPVAGRALARFLELRGRRVFEAHGVLWGHYRGPFFIALPYEAEFDLSAAAARDILRSKNIRALRFGARSGPGMESGIYCCDPRGYGLRSLRRACRDNVLRGLDRCEIREVGADELLEEGIEMNLETMHRQHRFDPEFGDPAQWRRFVDAVRRSPDVTVTGAYVNGRLSVYGVCCQDGGCLHLLHKMGRTGERRLMTGHALDYAIVTAAARDSSIRLVEDSFVSVRRDAGLDAYKRGMGFRVEPRRMAIHFHPRISWLAASRVSVAAAGAAWRLRPEDSRLELAAKLLRGARETMSDCQQTATAGMQLPIIGQDPCQATEPTKSSTLRRPWPLSMLPYALLHLRRTGPAETVRKVAGALRRIAAASKPAPRIASPPLASEVLALQPGEWVEVKSEQEIRATLDAHGKHRGLSFVGPEMFRHCGGSFRVLKRVERIFLEESRQNRRLRNTVLLEGVHCRGTGLECDRCCFLYWREAWLKRTDEPR